MKKRILVLLGVVALIVVMLAMGVTPAFAEADDNANCLGELASGGNQMFPGLGGRDISELAHRAGGLGRAASNNCFQSTS